MKQNLIKLAIVLVLCTLLIPVACKKSKIKKEPDTEEKGEEEKKPSFEGQVEITGNVSLPNQSPYNLNSLKVVSPIHQSDITNTKYKSYTITNFSTELVLDAEGNIVMMGYNYPDKNDKTIDANSTALGMVMNLPFALSLSSAGKHNLIVKAQSSPKLQILSSEISKSLAKGKSATDITNTAVIESLANLITDLTSGIVKKASSTRGSKRAVASIPSKRGDEPVKFNKAGRVLSIENNGLASAFAVGVYKQESNVKSFIVPGIKTLATSLGEIFSGLFGNGYTEPFQELVTLQNDEEYEIKIRSGKPGLVDLNPEFKKAMLANAEMIVETIVLNYLPQIADANKSCMGSFRAKTAVALNEALILLKGTDQNHLGSTAIDISLKALELGSGAFVDCGIEASYVKGLAKFFSFTGQVSKLANNINVMVQIYDWFNAEPAIDTCFAVVNNQIVPCSRPYKIEIESGDNQLGEPLKRIKDPLKVRVTDVNGNSMNGIEVEWSIKSGDSKLDAVKTMTNTTGIAQNGWTMGAMTSEQLVEASVKKKDGTLIKNAPIRFRIAKDSTEFYRAAVVGMWTVNGYDTNNPTSTYKVELFTGGGGRYMVPNTDTGEMKYYSMSWEIRKTINGYGLYERGFWHPAYDNLPRQSLSYPIKKFQVFGDAARKIVVQDYTKN